MEENNQEDNQETSNVNVADRKKAEIGHFDGELKTIAFNEGDNIQTLLNKANLDFSDGQSINDDEGNTVELTDQAEADKIYYITGNFKQGNL